MKVSSVKRVHECLADKGDVNGGAVLINGEMIIHALPTQHPASHPTYGQQSPLRSSQQQRQWFPTSSVNIWAELMYDEARILLCPAPPPLPYRV